MYKYVLFSFACRCDAKTPRGLFGPRPPVAGGQVVWIDSGRTPSQRHQAAPRSRFECALRLRRRLATRTCSNTTCTTWGTKAGPRPRVLSVRSVYMHFTYSSSLEYQYNVYTSFADCTVLI